VGVLQALLLVAALGALLYLLLIRPVFPARALFIALAAAFLVSTLPSLAGRYAPISPTLAAAALALAIPVLGLLAWLFRARPVALIYALVATMPLRVPIPVGARSVFLLVPLYVVILAGFLSLPSSGDEIERWRRDPLRLPLAALVALAGLSLLYTADPVTGVIRFTCFWLAFVLLYDLAVARSSIDRVRFHAVAALLGSGAVLAAIGLIQRALGLVLYNARVSEGYFAQTSFRVNSLFWDPNMFGRFLVVVILVAAVELLGRRDRALVLPSGAAAVVSLPALALTYSRSSWIALAAGLVLLAWHFAGRARALAVATALVLAVVIMFGAIDAPQFNLPTRPHARLYWEKFSGGRLGLIEGGAAIFAAHPVAGVGIGAFPAVFPNFRPPGYRSSVVESHNSLTTIAAELGLIGLALLAWLLFAVARVWRRVVSEDSDDPKLAAAFLVAAAAAAVHSLFYGALFEDPFVWFLLAAPAALWAGARGLAPHCGGRTN